MGTEFGIANYVDVVPAYLGEQIDTSRIAANREILYPLAMQVPGVLHIVDWIIHRTIEQLPFYPVWQKDAKDVLQTLHSEKLRDFMRSKIQTLDMDAQQISSLSRSLSTATGKFAQWRWRTLWNAANDLLRIEDALKVFMDGVSNPSKSLAIRKKQKAEDIKRIAEDTAFWHQTKAIRTILEPLMHFTSWIQGCDCHETELQKGNALPCALKGCRARHVALRVDKLKNELAQLRHDLNPLDFGGVPTSHVALALSESLSWVTLKMQWVREIPYLIWQAISMTYNTLTTDDLIVTILTGHCQRTACIDSCLCSTGRLPGAGQ